MIYYFIVFLASFLEALPLIGNFFPGQLIVVASGYFASLGFFSLNYLIAVVFFASIIGDVLSYFIGYYFDVPFKKNIKKLLMLEKKHIDYMKYLLREHGIKTILLAKFHSFSRSTASFMAGRIKMPFYKFFIITFFGSLLWTLAFVFLGYFLKDLYKTALKYVSITVVVVILLAVYFSYKAFIKKSK